MKVLIVGLGSIAQKHIMALRQLNYTPEILALRSNINCSVVDGVKNVFSWDEVPTDITFIIISNPTSEHLQTIQSCLKFRVPLFIEKPPFMSMNAVQGVLEQVLKTDVLTYTAFNLRFHPVIEWLKSNLVGKLVYEVHAYSGSYLPKWRAGRDYRASYSASKALGGGVHLDLIHELDYLKWLFGSPSGVYSDIGKISNLEIDSADIAHYWLKYPNLRIAITLNYFRRDAKRGIEIVMEDESWYADLLKGRITNSANECIAEFNDGVPQTYSRQMKYFIDSINASPKRKVMNDLREATETLKICLNA